MSDQLLKIAEGGGDLVTRLQINTKDEIRDVADAYNKLVDGFRELVVQVQDTAGKVGIALRRDSTTEEIRQASHQTSGIMEELAAENQLQDTEETTATVTDMAEGMKHIAHAAQDVFGLANDEPTCG